MDGFEEVSFHRGQRVKVTNAVAKALTENPDLFPGPFIVEDEGEVSDEEKAEAKAAAQLAEAEAAQAAVEAEQSVTDTGTSQESVSPPKASTSRGSTP